MNASPNRFCPQCGTPLAPIASVCSTCGRNIAVPSLLAPTQVASPAYPNTAYLEFSTPPDQSPLAPTPWASPYESNAYPVPGQPPLAPTPWGSSPYGVPAGISYAVPSQQGNMGVRTRPVGVTVLAVLVGLQAIDDLLSFLVGLSTGNVVGLVVVGILAVATLALAIGLWRMRPWAFWTAIVVEVIYLLFALLNLGLSTSPAVVIERVIIEVVIPLGVLSCLLAVRNVRAAIRGK